MTALFLIGCVSIITIICILTFKREKKFDKENPTSDYVRGHRRETSIIDEDHSEEIKILCADIAKESTEKQDSLDIIIENELKYIAKNNLSNMVFDDYCKFEDAVDKAMNSHCPESLKYIHGVIYGKTPELGRMRNFIRYQADNLIVCGVDLSKT